KLDDIAASTFRDDPAAIAQLGFAVADAIGPDAPDPGGVSDEVRGLAARIATDLVEAERPLVVAGPSWGHVGVMRAGANVVGAAFPTRCGRWPRASRRTSSKPSVLWLCRVRRATTSTSSARPPT